jgi:hypothetical protein
MEISDWRVVAYSVAPSFRFMLSVMSLMKSLIAAALLCLASACGSATTDGNVQEPLPAPLPPEPPPGEPVSFFELVPTAANGAGLVHVTKLRSSSHGPALTNLVRRLGVYRWEDAVGIDLRTQVERLLVFAVASREHGPGDLSLVLDALRQSNLGAIVELRAGSVEGAAECGDRQLAALEGEVVDASLPGVTVYRCGRFVIVRRDDLEGPLGPYPDAPVAQALQAAMRENEQGVAPIFAAVASPEMIDRVSCGETTVQLADWQQVTIEVGDGMTLGGRYHAANVDDVPQLEQCVSDGMGGFSNVPLFAQLELRDVLQNAVIARDEQTASDVTLAASFNESELDLLLGLLELVGSGI